MTKNSIWSRDPLLLALNLYSKLSFGQLHGRNPDIIRLSTLIGRSLDAVAMKLSNFASLDPALQVRGVKGLPNVSKADRAIWEEFTENWDDLAVESERILVQRTDSLNEITSSSSSLNETLALGYEGKTESERLVKIRLAQKFFRETVLSIYSGGCCICNLPIRELLVASHIIPWHENEKLRTNPHNGLCLCALHDRSFDRGLMGITPTYDVVISPIINRNLPNQALSDFIKKYEGSKIILPEKFPPHSEFLEFHLEKYSCRVLEVLRK